MNDRAKQAAATLGVLSMLAIAGVALSPGESGGPQASPSLGEAPVLAPTPTAEPTAILVEPTPATTPPPASPAPRPAEPSDESATPDGFEVIRFLPTVVVYGAAFSPDGERVMTGGPGGVEVWDVRPGASTHSFSSSASVHAVAFASDDQSVIAGDANGSLTCWSLETGEAVAKRETERGAPIDYLVRSPDGRRFAGPGTRLQANGVATSPALTLYSMRHLSPMSKANLDTHEVPALDTVERIAAGAQADREARGVAFSKDGGKLTSWGSHDGEWCLWLYWNGFAGDPKRVPLDTEGLGDELERVAFAPDGSRCAPVPTRGDRMRVYHGWTGALLWSQDLPGFSAAAISSKGELVAASARGLTLWSADGELLSEHPLNERDQVRVLCFSPDGDRVVAGYTTMTLYGLRRP